MKLRAWLNDPALRDFVGLSEGDLRVLVRRGLEGWALPLAARKGVAEAAGGLSVQGGRAAHPLVGLPDGGWAVVRRYHRGGMMRHLNRCRYFRGHRAFEELQATERARAAGAEVPEVLAAAEWRHLLGYGALLATRWIESATSLHEWRAKREHGEVLPTLRSTGEQIARIHEAGIAHPDVNLRNVLVSRDAAGRHTVHLIDFDRARLSSGPVERSHRLADVGRLARSARKFKSPLQADEWAALAEGYGPSWPLLDESSPSP